MRPGKVQAVIRNRSVRSFALAGLTALSLSACSSLSSVLPMPGSRDAGGHVPAGDLAASIQRVQVECQVAQERMYETVDALQTLVTPSGAANPAQAYEAFVQAVGRSQEQADALRGSVDPMKRAADPYFSRWAADLAAFTSPQMRQRSQARLTDTRRRYDGIVAVVEPLPSAYDAFNAMMRDYALYLEHDLNAASIASIEPEVRNVSYMSAELDGWLDKCMQASAEFVASATLPTPAPAPEAVEARD